MKNTTDEKDFSATIVGGVLALASFLLLLWLHWRIIWIPLLLGVLIVVIDIGHKIFVETTQHGRGVSYYRRKHGLMSPREIVDSHPLLMEHPVKRAPVPAGMVDEEALIADSARLFSSSTHGAPGSGISNASKFQGREQIGAKGEQILGGLIKHYGIDTIPGTHTFWSLKPIKFMDIDIDCAILHGHDLFLLDAKYYTPKDDAPIDYIMRAVPKTGLGSDDELAGTLDVLRLGDAEWQMVAEARYHALNGQGDFKARYQEAVDMLAENLTRVNEYHQTESGYLGMDAVNDVLRGDNITLHCAVLLSPTKKGVPGIGTDTDYDGNEVMDYAPSYIEQFVLPVLNNGDNGTDPDVVARLDMMTKK